MDSKESVAFRSAMERPGVWTVVAPDEWHLFDQPEDNWECRDDEIGLDDQRKLIIYLEEPPYPRLWIRICHKDSPKEHPPRREMSIPRGCSAGAGTTEQARLDPAPAANRCYTEQDISVLVVLVCEGRTPDRSPGKSLPSWLAGVLSHDWRTEHASRDRLVALRRLLRARLPKQRVGEIMDRVVHEARQTYGWYSEPKKQPRSKGQHPQPKRRGRGGARGGRRAGKGQQPRHAYDTGYSGYAYIRPTQPPAEPWHSLVPPWEDRPSWVDERDLGRVHESDRSSTGFEDLGGAGTKVGPGGVKKGQSAWGSWPAMPEAWPWPSMPPAALRA
jgi:hypothetical protein